MKKQIILACQEPIARAVYDKVRKVFSLPLSTFDSGYPVLDYSTSQKFTLKGKGDQYVHCEEIWETSFNLLDNYGVLARWQDDPHAVKVKWMHDTISRYQKFRKFLEKKLRRPIPWVLQAPTILTSYNKQKKLTDSEKNLRLNKLSKKAEKIRARVYRAIEKLESILVNAKPEDRERCLITGLFWFVYTGKPHVGKTIPDNAIKSLKEYNLSEFANYLHKEGGLGMSEITRDRGIEGTALETVLERRGKCTEKSKVLYAVLRMAGIKAFFVEPRLTLNYFAKKKKLGTIGVPPLPNHIALGVGVEIRDKNGRQEIWILDTSQDMVKADYIKKNHYWKLSLRHYFMTDLSNLGVNLEKAKYSKRAKSIYDLALKMGSDSTACHIASNYSGFLMAHKNLLPARDSPCSSAESCATLAYRINSRNVFVLYNYAMSLEDKAISLKDKAKDLENSKPRLALDYYLSAIVYFTLALEYYPKVIRQDPRFVQSLERALQILDRYARTKTMIIFESCWKRFSDALRNTLSPRFQKILKGVIRKMSKRNFSKKMLNRLKQLAVELDRGDTRP